MRVPMNDLKRAHDEQREALHEAVERVLDSGWYVHGPEHAAFEEELASYLGVGHVVGVGNGTDALEIGIRAAARPGTSSVLTAANAGGYTTTATLRAGLAPVYADVDPDTLCLSPATVEAALDDEVAAVVVTHLYGRMAPVEEIAAICRARDVPVIEDCAQAIGARRGGVMAGAVGLLSTFSFYPTKNLGALGDGGAMVTSDDDLAERLRTLRQYGWERKYVSVESGGRNSRLDELQAAVLRVRLRLVDDANERRRQIIGRYAAAAGGGVSALPATGPDHVGHLAVMLVPAPRRAEIRTALEERGIATDVHYPVPDHRQPALASSYADVQLPVTERTTTEILTLPCFAELTDAEVDHVAAGIAAL
jgi:dTDP-3-amino-2,3,6-trideoxy-4-keto-D-glucose/dTDP-3-amino-3,4,6-trideoxy-alpha-D-glucose/dTDP-2,6-dideoxy-D-kanosamine transaminase